MISRTRKKRMPKFWGPRAERAFSTLRSLSIVTWIYAINVRSLLTFTSLLTADETSTSCTCIEGEKLALYKKYLLWEGYDRWGDEWRSWRAMNLLHSLLCFLHHVMRCLHGAQVLSLGQWAQVRRRRRDTIVFWNENGANWCKCNDNGPEGPLLW